MENEIIKNFELRIPVVGETQQESEYANDFHEMEFFKAESFKIGFLLGMEIAEHKKKN